MDSPDLVFHLPDEAATARFGAWLAPRLGAGDCVLLSGPIGAGKSQLARALIQTRLGRLEEVPSPTFTIVQTYEAADLEIWHADLYRLSHPDEVAELGLEMAFATALCLIEWPDRLGRGAPPNALRIALAPEREGRALEVTCPHHPALMAALRRDWGPVSTRATLSQRFLEQAGWGAALRAHLAGDASDRSYERLRLGTETAVLMDAPPGQGDDPATFVAIARHLAAIGLSAPRVLAQDLAHGFLLLEDLGDGLFARLLAQNPTGEAELYAAATDALLHLHAHPPAPGLPDATAADWGAAVALAVEWYRFGATGARADAAPLTATLAAALATLADGPRVMILRDFHAENLIWLPARHGIARVGLLDFQLAQLGQPGYDLVSLLQDARRDVSAPTEEAMIRRFIAATGAPDATFRSAYATLGAQRALRIIGVFARLCMVAGKAGYLPLLPRVWRQLQRNLAHPALADLAACCAALIPEPTPAILQRLGTRCGQHR